MTRKHLLPIAVVLVAVNVLPIASNPAMAQARTSAPVVLEQPASTRAMAIGNSYVMSSTDPDALFYNPALLTNASGAGFGVQRFGTASTLVTMATAMNSNGFGFGFGIQSLSYTMGSDDFSQIPATDNALLTQNAFGASELVGTVGLARSFFGIRFGVAGKVAETRLSEARSTTVAFDVGAVASILDMTVGLTAQNLGRKLDIAGTSPSLPHRFTLAATTPQEQIGPLDFYATASVSRFQNEEFVPAGGIEVRYWPINGRTFIGRIGAQRVPTGDASPLTFGAAFMADNITIEYAFREFDASGASHRFGLRWR